MAKLASQDKFVDLSDYGRISAIYFVNIFKNTSLSAVHITILFLISGLIAIWCIIYNHYYLAGVFLILKSILDAADGEMSRAKNQPSYTGRYLDSIFDIILNLLLFVTITYVTGTHWGLTIIAFICFQLQGTLYNYYYVILRNKSYGADSTSKVFEYRRPKALEIDNQKVVNILFFIFMICYAVFDKLIFVFDPSAYKSKALPNWFMTSVSIYGLGFQLLIMALFLAFDAIQWIIPFFIWYSVFIVVFISIRKKYL
jgi:phosphatidylglycerophosphate synthase